MIKAIKGNTYILGLSDKNIELLKSEKPIKFDLKELGLGDGTMIIFNGRDETSMALSIERLNANKN